MTTTYTLHHNAAAHRYEFQIEGAIAYIEYERTGEVLTLAHTIVPKALEGRGIASALTRAVLEEIRANGLRIIPQCPFTATYVTRHPEWLEWVEK